MDKSVRLMSLDALRGFDMFWIMGGEMLLVGMGVLLGFAPNDCASAVGHVPWNGIHFMDLIFPTFLFLAGVSFPFSLEKSRAKGLSTGAIALRVLRRGVTLILLGILYNGFLEQLDFATFRIPSVLGYIGFGWMGAAWIYLLVGDVRKRLVVLVALLGVVTLVFGFIPAPDAPAGLSVFDERCHLGCWLDRTILGAHIGKYTPLGMGDPEGFGGLLCTIATAQLGMLAGDLVRWGGKAATGRKALWLLLAGAVSLVMGLLLSLVYPIVKALWSPSFVLVAGAYSFAMFALFYWLIDVKGFSRWSFFFRVIGMNSITIYLSNRIFNFCQVSDFFCGGLKRRLPDCCEEACTAVFYIAICWLLLYFLHRQKVYLKV